MQSIPRSPAAEKAVRFAVHISPGEPGATDQRLAAFGDLIQAADSGDARGVLAAARRLRAMNLSVVVLSPRGQGGRR